MRMSNEANENNTKTQGNGFDALKDFKVNPQQPQGAVVGNRLDDLGRTYSGKLSETGQLEELVEKLNEVTNLAENKQTLDASVFLLRKESLKAPLLLIAAKAKDGVMKDTVVYQPIIISKLAKELEAKVSKEYDNAGQALEFVEDTPIVAIFDQYAEAWSAELLATKYDNPAEFIHTAPIVLPEGIQLNEPDVLEALVTSTLGILTDLVGGEVLAITSDYLTGSDISMRLRPIQTVNDPVLDPIGRPVSADFCANLQLVSETQYQRMSNDLSVNNPHGARAINAVTAYGKVEFLPAHNRAVTAEQLRAQKPNQQFFAGYDPVIVVTAANNPSPANEGRQLEDTSTQILALVAVHPMMANYRWVAPFEPAGKSKVRKSLGLLSLEWDPTLSGAVGKEETLVASSTANAKGVKTIDYARTMVTEDVILAMDFGQGSYSAPYQIDLVNAATAAVGSPEESSAVESIIDVCDSLTAGQFSVLMEREGRKGQNPVSKSHLTLHNGTYVGAGVKRPLTDFGYLESLDFAGNDEHARVGALRAITDLNTTDRRVMAARRNILKLAPEAKIDSITTRIFFQGWFLRVLLQALSAAKANLVVEDVNPYAQQMGQVYYAPQDLGGQVSVYANNNNVVGGYGAPIYAGVGLGSNLHNR